MSYLHITKRWLVQDHECYPVRLGFNFLDYRQSGVLHPYNCIWFRKLDKFMVPFYYM